MNVGEVVKVVEHFAMEREREIAELREQVKFADARTAEQIRDKTRILNDYEEQAKSLREQVATLARERDRYRDLCRRFRNLFAHDGSIRCGPSQRTYICRDYDATHAETPAPEPDAAQAVVDAAVRYINSGNEIPGGMLPLWRVLRDGVLAWKGEVGR